MSIQILNQDFEIVDIIEEYESLIWTDRYNTPGDFELFSPAVTDSLNNLVRDNYVRMTDSDHMMVIEDIVYSSSAESGKNIKVVGRSLESILDRRIVWGTIDLKGYLEDVIELLFNTEIINPAFPERKINNFVFQRSGDPRIAGLQVTQQYTGDTLLNIIQNLTEEFDIGWRIILNSNNQFVFSFYVGTDRSYNQNNNPYVVFSPAYGNVINSNFTILGANYKTVILVSADGETTEEGERTKIYRTVGGGSGLLRREMFSNEVGIEKDEEMSQEDYEKALDQFGTEELQKNAVTTKFDGEYETKLNFKYGTDFLIGDVVEVADEFGNFSSSKVIEFIWSNDTTNGESSYPTFRATEN